MKPAEFHPDAETELGNAAKFYDAEHERLGTEFTNRVEQAVQFIRVQPEAGRPIRGLIRG